MNRAARKMALLERRPWTLALISAAGVTLLVPSVLALYGPPELLDSAIALGDTRLALGLTGLFALSAGVLRLLLRRRRLAEEQLDEEPPRAEPDAAHAAPATAARAHLR
jgi:hypothetical protein